MSHRSLIVALLLTACASEEAAPPPPPAPPADQGYVGSADGRVREQRSSRVPAGHMLVNVTKADLSTEVLPLFEQQVGVTITWHGDPRPVTLRLSQTMPWDEILSLVCQFTRTHATKDYQGRLVLKDGWGGDLGDGDIRALQAEGAATVSSRGGQRGGSRGGAGSSAGSNPGWSGGSAPASGGGGTSGSGIPEPTGAYSGGAEAGRLLRGANTRTSNAGP
jgi:hypothetical protein